MPSVTKIRRGTTAGWTKLESSGQYLENGQLGYNKDTKELKIGTGATPFADLPNIMAGVDPNIYTNTGVSYSGDNTFIFPISMRSNADSSKTGKFNFSLQRLPNGYHLMRFFPSTDAVNISASLGTSDNPWTGATITTINAITVNTSNLQVDDNMPQGKSISVAASLIPSSSTYGFTLGTSENSWDSVFLGEMQLKYNETEECIEFLSN